MKLIYTLLIAFLISSNLFSQAPGWQWAMGAGGAGTDETGSGITTDGSGNIYSLGAFGCNTLTIGTKTLVRSGGGNPYVVKQDASGNVLWAKSYAFSPPTFFGIGAGKSIFADASGNVYITGYYYTSIVIGTTTLIATDSSSSSAGDVFVAKLDASGNALWAKSAGGAVGDMVNSITADASGNVYITGTFRSRYMRFGSGITLFNPNSTSTNFYTNTDIYVAKYDASGNPQWAKNTINNGGGLNDGKSICTDAAGNVLVAGTFYYPNIAFGTNTLTGTAAVNLFVTKYDNAGNVIWAKTANAAGSGSINHTATGITSDANNNVYITGANGASTLTIGSVVLTNSGGYAAKLDASGNCQWAKSIIGGAYSTGIAQNGGNVYVTGYFDGMNCIFGTDTIKNKNTAGNNEDIFVTKLNSSGAFQWAAGAGGIYRDISNGISVDPAGNANITGYTLNTALTFGTLSLTCTGGYNDIFIAKMGTMSGIDELNKNKDQFVVYPNPGNGIFSLQTKNEISTVEIMNVLGEIIYRENIFSSDKIDISDKPKGIYFIRAEDKNKILLSGKIILE
jgi:hypothetical protein